jgi:hypothetical protein
MKTNTIESKACTLLADDRINYMIFIEIINWHLNGAYFPFHYQFSALPKLLLQKFKEQNEIE